MRELHSAIKLMLNHFEGLSAAYLNGVADKDMFEISFKKLIAKWYSNLYLYIEVAGDKCNCDWQPFVALGKAWADTPLPTDTGIQSTCVKAAQDTKPQ